jgi:DNA-binding MarR family transcriptional regulator/DNA-binding Lrp family transcriptional regulator
MAVRRGWKKSYGVTRKRQISSYRKKRQRIVNILAREGSTTAMALSRDHGIPQHIANKVLHDLERRGEHAPPDKRAYFSGQKPPNEARRLALKQLLDSGAQIRDVLALPQYSGPKGRALLFRDLEGIRKYWDAEFAIHKTDPIDPQSKRVAELIQENPRRSTGELADLMNVGLTAVRRYLQRVPQHIIDLRIYPGNNYSVGELRRQNITILTEYLRGTKLADIANIVNEEAKLRKVNATLDRLTVSNRLSGGANKDRAVIRNRTTGTTTHSREELIEQNRMIIDLVARGWRPADISEEIEKMLGHVVTPGQVSARISNFRKRAAEIAAKNN